jgi:uncharacterized protein (DUF1501 family)
MAQTRRQFLQTGCGALSAGALLSGLGRFALIDALAQSTDASYKALVCVFLYGGNDANNVVIPYDNYDTDYKSVRGNSTIAIAKDALLKINPGNRGTSFGFHPRFGDAITGSPSLNDLWGQQKMAVVCNTGPLIRRVTRTEYRAGTARPYQLFSHSDQQNSWQTSYATGPKQTGWAGSTEDRLGATTFPVIASISGVTLFSTGLNTRPLVLSSTQPINQTLKLLRTADRGFLEEILTGDGLDPMPELVKGATQLTQRALANGDLLTSDPAIATVFPGTSLGNQLKQVAKLIKLAPTLGLTRQIFFTSIGGFDTHQNQGNATGNQANLLSQVSAAIGAFYQATVELGVSGKVVTFTSSDFSRTFVPNGDGTDHAWGSHQFIVGDAVLGGDFYGAVGVGAANYPALVVGDGQDSQDTDAGTNARGRWIPTTSVDQYAATLASWYGLTTPSELAAVFPNLGQFSPQTLRFLV